MVWVQPTDRVHNDRPRIIMALRVQKENVRMGLRATVFDSSLGYATE